MTVAIRFADPPVFYFIGEVPDDISVSEIDETLRAKQICPEGCSLGDMTVTLRPDWDREAHDEFNSPSRKWQSWSTIAGCMS